MIAADVNDMLAPAVRREQIDPTPHLEETVRNGQRHTPVIVGQFVNGSPEWHAARANGIGGSEVAPVLGISPFDSAYSLWQRKKGNTAPTETSVYMEWGNRLEDAVCQKFLDEHPEYVSLGTATYCHPERPWQIANPDLLLAFADNPTVPVAIFEAKTSGYGDGWGEHGTDDLPAYYKPQGTHYLDVMGLLVCHFGVLIGGNDYREFVWIYNEAEAHANAAACAQFIATLDGDVPPAIDNSSATWDAVRDLNPDIGDDTIDVPDDLAIDFITATEQFENAKAAHLGSKARLADFMGSAKSAKWNGLALASRQQRGGDVPYIVKARSLPKITGTAPAVSAEAATPAATVDSATERPAAPAGRAGSSPTKEQNATPTGTPGPAVPGLPDVHTPADAEVVRETDDVAAVAPHGDGDGRVPTSRTEWVVNRVAAVAAIADAARTLKALWPEGVATFAAIRNGNADPHTNDELDLIVAALDETEKRHTLPFGVADPTIAKPAPKPQRGAIDEGPDVTDDAVQSIRSVNASLDRNEKEVLNRWSTEATAAKRSFSLRHKKSVRRFNIVTAAINLVRWDLTDDAARTAIGIVMGEEVQPSVTVGQALGSLTSDEAERLTTVVVSLAAGSGIAFGTDGTPSLVA